MIGGNVDSVVVDVVVLSAWFEPEEPPKPATATDSLAVDFRFLASIGDSDLLKRPAVRNEWESCV